MTQLSSPPASGRRPGAPFFSPDADPANGLPSGCSADDRLIFSASPNQFGSFPIMLEVYQEIPGRLRPPR